MSAFDFSFALLSLLLGLGFAALADAAAKLLLAAERVRWDWLSPLVAVNVFLEGLIYWWFQWSLRNAPVVLVDVTARAIACLILYVLAVAALPQPQEGRIDLRDQFARSRRLVNGAFALFIVLVAYILPGMAGRGFDRDWATPISIALFVIGIFVANRWLQTVAQLFFLIVMGMYWMPLSIRV